MTPDLTNLEARLDRDRRLHEAVIAAYLLALASRAKRQSYAAVRVGASPFQALTDVYTGNFALGIPSPAPVLASHLSNAAASGFRRTTLVLPGEPMTYVGSWLGTAVQALGKMVGTLQRKVMEAFGKAKAGIAGRLAAIRDAFTAGGFTAEKPWLVNTAAETMVANAYYGGYWGGWSRPDIAPRLTGFRYSSTLDQVTTPICRTYHGVQLVPSDPWWLTHWPSNHFGCRANVLPLFGAFTPIDPPLLPAPMPGFGRAPVGFGGVLVGRRAA
jgi:hypothetical protein